MDRERACYPSPPEQWLHKVTCGPEPAQCIEWTKEKGRLIEGKGTKPRCGGFLTQESVWVLSSSSVVILLLSWCTMHAGNNKQSSASSAKRSKWREGLSREIHQQSPLFWPDGSHACVFYLQNQFEGTDLDRTTSRGDLAKCGIDRDQNQCIVGVNVSIRIWSGPKQNWKPSVNAPQDLDNSESIRI